MVIVRSKLKELAAEHGIDNVTAEFPEKLNEKVKRFVAEACRRAKDNGRRTVMGKDL